MCRFLLIEGEKPFDTQELIHQFSDMSEKSKAYDGSRQGDGCGASWLENGQWRVQTSIKPFWESLNQFDCIPPTARIVMHARSASFRHQIGSLEYSQPYIADRYAFVFNGLLKGVRLPKLEGTIGAQKIWSLLRQFLAENEPVGAIQKTVEILNTHAREIQALNIGLSDGGNLYAYTQFSGDPEYYNLQVAKHGGMYMVCSETIGGMNFERLEPGKVYKF